MKKVKITIEIIGIDEKHIHYKPNRTHLDICQSKKKEALSWGFPSIIELKDSEIIKKLFSNTI
jgi:hypothetical protein